MLTINNSKVILIKDFLLLKEKDLIAGTEKDIIQEKSNVLQFILEDGSKISVRPSGTEPKIKFYFSVRENLESKAKFDEVEAILNQKIMNIITSMKLK
jgi:phosphoglucomutase